MICRLDMVRSLREPFLRNGYHPSRVVFEDLAFA